MIGGESSSPHKEISESTVLFSSMFLHKLHLNEKCGIFLLQEVLSYERGPEPALQNDEATHHLFVMSVLEQLPLLFLEENLSR